jgi:hypothetical protein
VIQVRYLSGLIALINEQMGAEDEGAAPAGGQPSMGSSVRAHYRNTLGELNSVWNNSCLHILIIPFSVEYIRNRQRSPETAEKFSAIQM